MDRAATSRCWWPRLDSPSFDLTIGVGAGLAMAVVLFVRQMEGMAHVKLLTPDNDVEMDSNSLRGKVVPPGVVLYRLQGPLVFAAADNRLAHFALNHGCFVLSCWV
jgi:MFS superfamily sulfate permease-like transporter